MPESCDTIPRQLDTIDEIVNKGPDRTGTLTILGMIGLLTVNEQFLTRMRLYSDYLPKPGEVTFSDEQRLHHLLWDEGCSPRCGRCRNTSNDHPPAEKEGLFREQLNHIWLHDGAFQDE